jgi:hypothetical protein
MAVKESFGRTAMANRPTAAKRAAPEKTPVQPLTAQEIRIAAEFFERCAEDYVDHSANDFDLPDTPVQRKIVKAAEKRYAKISGNKPDKLSIGDEVINATDYILFHYLAQRWGWLAHRLERGNATEPLASEELLTGASLLELLSRNDYEEYAKPKDDPDYSLSPTPEGQQLAEAVIWHKGARDADKRIKTALAGEYGCDVHATWLLAYLAARCRAIAKASPAVGMRFDGDYMIASEADKDEVPAKGAASGTGTLPVIRRRGVSPRWLREWNKFSKLAHKTEFKNLRQYYVDRLMAYVTDGFPEPGKSYTFYRAGEDLGRYAFCKITMIEEHTIQLGHHDGGAWMPVFAGGYFSVIMEVGSFKQPGSAPEMWPINYLDAAMGMVIGCKKEALGMAQALIYAHRFAKSEKRGLYPASQCVLQIFASFLGEAPLKLEGQAESNTVYKALAAHWRHPDAETLTPLLLAVCDEHTHRNAFGYDLDFEQFARTPVEILLVFKLRETLGLPNPKLDHPLMNTPLGQLPQEVPFATDEVITALINRARVEGFDENKTMADIVKAAEKAK